LVRSRAYEQSDALEAVAFNSFQYLAVPRIVAA
jgi:ABC-type transporter Mla maintaining outer membrane lipid asymmetry permease subunit MlaE